MHKVTIIGDLPEYGKLSQEQVESKVTNAVDLISYQYNGEVVFNVDGSSMVGLWVCKACQKFDCRFHIYLPYHLNNIELMLTEQQFSDLVKYMDLAKSSTISCNDQYNQENLVSNSSFILCFWSGRKQGPIYGALLHALDSSKIIIDGANDLRLLSRTNIVK
jgi:hypothetical protein